MGLFGDEFNITMPEKKSVKDIISKVNAASESSEEAEKVLKSKKVDIHEKLQIINANVIRVLGKQAQNILVIKDKKTFDNYITSAIESGIVAIDTETNNSLDPVTCKLMGPCLYYPGGKQAYIPINHRNPDTKERFDWQLTEEDCAEEFKRINDSGILQIFHNAKFDYEVIKCTCGVALNPYWDTFIGARLLNENEPAGLKEQYRTKIDSEQEKYDIDGLFKNVLYADVDPEIFAYYAAHDSGMTYELYLYQKEEFEKPEYGPHKDMSGKHDVKGLRWLFHNVEMPISVVTAEMELLGVKVDTELGERLKRKYNSQLEDIDKQIAVEMEKLKPIIEKWKLTPEANERTKMYPATKSKMTSDKIEKMYPEVDKDGKRYKIGKAKIEQLEDPINLASPVQLAILFYDILGIPAVNKKSPRATGEEELKEIAKKNDLPICKLLLERRGNIKLTSTYIDVIPKLSQHWPDGRIRFHLNNMGTDTGRYSSGGTIKYLDGDEPVEVSGINIQNIPSHCPEIRLLFKGDTIYHNVEDVDDCFEVPETDEVETLGGWKLVSEIKIGDRLVFDGGLLTVIDILFNDRKYFIKIA